MGMSEFKGIFKSSKVKIKSMINTKDDYYVMELEKNKDMTWKAGEHAMITLPGVKIEGRKFRGFSVASIPSENKIVFGFRTGHQISSFKKALINMKPGDEIGLRGPFGGFLIKDETSPVVFIASGVGITPFRALLKELEHNTKRWVEIIYASNEYYLFGDEIEKIVAKNPKMKLHKTVTVEETQNKINTLAKKYNNEAYYYVSGAPKVITSIKQTLKTNSIKGKRILSDIFMGY